MGPLDLIADAKAFVRRILEPPDPRQCPHCGSTLTKKNGGYGRSPRDLGGIRSARVQRHLCHTCHGSYSEPLPGIAPRRWYSRRAQRKFLDMYTTMGGSLRRCAGWITAEITGRGRTFVWDVLARLPWWERAPEPEPEIELSHTTGWRWLQEAGQAWQKKDKPYAGLRQSGLVATDGTYVRVRGVWTAVLGIVDALSRVVFGPFRLDAAESGPEIERAFALAQAAGLDLDHIRVLLSDGAAGFREFLARCLHWAAHQRCLFHLWRQVWPIIAHYGSVAGKDWATGLKLAIGAVWNAASRAEGEVALRLLLAAFGAVPIAQEAVRIVQDTFAEAMTHVGAGMADVSRSTAVCEWVWRYYKERVRQMGGFMSAAGCENFTTLWGLALNFRRYQRRKERLRQYKHPGLCPLELAGAMVQGVTWLDAVGV